MSEYDTHTGPPPVDELWLGDWVAAGVAALEAYLAKQAAFAAFLAATDVNGDGAAPA